MGLLKTLDETSNEIQYLCRRDKRLAKLISCMGPVQCEICDDPYEFLIHEIIEQMLSVKTANIIFSRLVELCSGKITPVAIDKLSDEEIKSIGTTNSKVSYIRNVTHRVLHGDLKLDDLKDMNDADVFKILTSIKGIGKWTANMYLIFVLDRMDILPTNDTAFLQSYSWLYKTTDCAEKSVIKKCKKWKPYSSIAARYLYRALDSGLTKEEFHLYK